MPEILSHDPMASTERTRQAAHALVAALTGAGGSDDRFDGMSLWVAGSSWWSGDLTPEKAARVQEQFHRCLKGGRAGLSHEVHSIIADGNKAAIEMRIYGEWHDGRQFSKDLHIALDILEGNIVSYREYGFDDSFFAKEPRK